MADELEDIGKTLRVLAATAQTPKQLLKETLRRHPKASKKEVARAAFMAMIDAAPHDAAQAVKLQDVGLNSRTLDG